MTAGKLAARYELGLEHDRDYDGPLARFCDMLVDRDVSLPALRDFLRTDLPPERPDVHRILFLETAARLLGQKWVEDDCSFIDVTIATARLQEIIRGMSGEFRDIQLRPATPHVLLVCPAGEQHTLMLHLLALLFDALGWTHRLVDGRAASGPPLERAIEEADIICIGWSSEHLRGAFTDLVETIRRAAPDRQAPIVAGGFAALDCVDFLVSLGIDCICDSIYSASRICECFYEFRKASQQAPGHGRTAAGTAGNDWLVP
ncbi:cobalamin-binding protein [Ensifer soli]|uniref:cobalamin-binding protein n=1 Tax=Ciceribacter sp. sgz301302 TaxID=3342379 RepID=UPI0035BB6058